MQTLPPVSLRPGQTGCCGPPRTRSTRGRLLVVAVTVVTLIAGRLGGQTLPPMPGASAEELKQLSMEDLMHVQIITATQVISDPFSLPFMAQGFTHDDQHQRMPRTLPHWLDGVPGVMVQKTAYGQLSPYIRGLTGFRTLLLIDGIRLNNSVFREGPNQYWNTVDPLGVGRLEIVKGPASVLYGSDSIGGTVNTLSSEHDFANGHDRWRGEVFYRYASAEDSHSARAEVSGPLGAQAALSLGITEKSFGDFRAGPALGRRPHTGYDERAYDGKLEYRLRPNVRLVLAHQAVDQDDVWRTHSTIHGDTWLGLAHGSDRERSTDQNRRLSYTQLHATELKGFLAEIHVSLSDQVQEEIQTRIRSDGRTDLAAVEVATLGASVQALSQTRFGQWVYGATSYHDRVASSSARYHADGSFDRAEIQGPVGDDSRYDLTGCYAQNTFPAWGPVDLTVRGRFDRAAATIGRMLNPATGTAIAYSDAWSSFVGSARAAWHFGSRDGADWLAFTGVSQGFRAPNLSDLSRLDSAASGQIETPRTNISPEHFISYEVGVKSRSDHHEAAVTLFHTAIDDMIIRRPTGRVIDGLDELTKSNSGEGFIRGIELLGRLDLGRGVSLRAAHTWMDGEITVFPTNDPQIRQREFFSRLMPTTTQVGIRWEPAHRRFWTELSGTFVARQDKLSSGDLTDHERIPPGGTPGYAVYHVRGGWQATEQLTVSAAIENLTDRDHRVHGSGVNEPGRNVIVSARLRF